jgi:hypothetical protein
MMNESRRAVATLQLLAYEAQGIPAAWFDVGHTSTYAGACAHRKMLNPEYGVPLANRDDRADGYPKVVPLEEALKKYPNFYCYGCDRNEFNFDTNLHFLREHLDQYEIPHDQVPAGTSGPEGQPLEPEAEL